MSTGCTKGINRIRWTESAYFSCAGGHGGPPLHGGFVATKIKYNRPAPQRDARWDVEREGREPKVSQPTKMEPVCTGDFGTSARHPPRERIESPISKSLSREGVAALPYTEFIHVSKFTKTDQPANAMRGGMLNARAGRRKCSNRQEWSQCVPATSARARGTHQASELKAR